MSDLNYTAVIYVQVELSVSVQYRGSIWFSWIFRIYLSEQNLSLQSPELDLGYYDKTQYIDPNES